MKSLMMLVLCLFFTSCATRYGIVAGGQHVNYSESSSFSPYLASEDISLGNYEMKANGFHVGLSEETPNFLTKLVYFQNKYGEENFMINSEDTLVNLKESGIRGSIAWKLGFFQPYVMVSANRSTIKGQNATLNVESDGSYTSLGFGADLEFQIGRKTFLYMGYSQDSHDEIKMTGSGSATAKLRHTTFSLGLRFNFKEEYSR